MRRGGSRKFGEIEPDDVGEGAPRILGTVARHPHLLEPMLRFSSALAAGALGRRESEVLALRAAWNCRSDFEWGQRLRVLPNHSCLAAALHDRFFVARGEEIVDEWRPLRGW